MTSMLGVIFFLWGAAVVVWMVRQAALRRHDLLCLRNLFLLGFVIFQLVSAGLSMWTLTFGDFFVNSPFWTGIKYFGLAAVFLTVFIWAYEKGWLVRKPAWRSAYPFPQQRPTTLLTIAALFLGIGFVLRVVIGRNVPVLGVLTDIMAIGVLAGAAGLATWAWVPRLFNLAIAIPAAAIILGAIGSTLYLTFGRRDVLSVLLTVLFAAYHVSWKYESRAKLAYRMGILATVGIFFMAAFSTVRATTSKSFDFGEVIHGLTEADVSGGLEALASGQYAAACSMWLIENRPPYDPFHSVIYTITNPIPRTMWPDKPVGLGYTMVREANVYRYAVEYTVGAGIIGHIVNDNPWLTLIPYAIFFGLLWRFFDEYATAHPTNPFVILPVVVGSGDLIGIPRGEVGLFLFRSLTAMFTAWIAMRFCAMLLRRFGGPAAFVAEPDDEYAEGAPVGETDYPAEFAESGTHGDTRA